MATYNIKINLIINTEDGKPSSMNFIDRESGDDVYCEIIDGEIYQLPYAEDENGEVVNLQPKKITFSEFFELVSQSVQK